MRIEFVIDELVLTGFDPRDRHRIADALQGELAAGLATEGLAGIGRAGARQDLLRAPDVRVTEDRAGSRAETLGRDAAKSILRGITCPDDHRPARTGATATGRRREPEGGT